MRPASIFIIVTLAFTTILFLSVLNIQSSTPQVTKIEAPLVNGIALTIFALIIIAVILVVAKWVTKGLSE